MTHSCWGFSYFVCVRRSELLLEPATGLDDPSSCTPMASPEETTTYTVTITTINGCVDTASVVVTVTDDNGWEELQLAGIVLYPQPATGQVQIDGLGAFR